MKYDNITPAQVELIKSQIAVGATADTGTLTGASWGIDSSSIAFTGTTGTTGLQDS